MLAPLGLAPPSLLPTSSEQRGVVDGPQSSHHVLPPAFTASTAQPMDPGPAVLLPSLAGTRANMAFLRGLKKPQPHCVQPLLK